jgi:hypothetical protein
MRTSSALTSKVSRCKSSSAAQIPVDDCDVAGSSAHCARHVADFLFHFRSTPTWKRKDSPASSACGDRKNNSDSSTHQKRMLIFFCTIQTLTLGTDQRFWLVTPLNFRRRKMKKVSKLTMQSSLTLRAATRCQQCAQESRARSKVARR